METTPKPFWKSKTIWIGIIAFAVGVLQAIQGNLEIGAPLTMMAVIQIILRALTGSPLMGKSKVKNNQ